MYITYLMNHMWVIGAFFKKWIIVHYSRMESKFQNLKPYNIYFNYVDFKFLDQNLRSWPSFEKLSPTFFATSNFETRLSRDPITWHPEVRCFGYKMTHFIILPPQKIFSRTLQILGFIAESGLYTLRAILEIQLICVPGCCCRLGFELIFHIIFEIN